MTGLSILVSGSDTDVGKTWVATTLARMLSQKGQGVQVVKPVETGVGNAASGDVDRLLHEVARTHVTGFTLHRFPEPLAPLKAAHRAGRSLSLDQLIGDIRTLPASDWRIIEGAGGIAVPLDSQGQDWSDLAVALQLNYVVLVVNDRLGAINQARLAYAYARSKGLNAGIWLNARDSDVPLVHRSNIEGCLGAALPVWAVQRHREKWPAYRNASWFPVADIESETESLSPFCGEGFPKVL